MLLLLTPDEPLSAVVRFAALAASQQGEPLTIAMLTKGTHVGAPCMATLDVALQTARAAAPRIRVCVDTIAPTSVGASAAALVADGLIVTSPQTWARLADYARIERAAGTVVQMIEPEA